MLKKTKIMYYVFRKYQIEFNEVSTLRFLDHNVGYGRIRSIWLPFKTLFLFDLYEEDKNNTKRVFKRAPSTEHLPNAFRTRFDTFYCSKRIHQLFASSWVDRRLTSIRVNLQTDFHWLIRN